MSLKEVYCQDKAIETFQRATQLGRLSHAYIFAGPDGVGKNKMAKEWAKTLLCKSPTTESTPDGEFLDNCENCESCLLFQGNAHPDIKYIYKELIRFSKKSENRKKTPIDMPKDVITEFVIDQVANRPKTGDKVVFIIDEAEKLNNSSQNALLKTLEEPPAHCIIILLCNRLDKLLPTTLSRCQVVKFGSINEDIITEQLLSNGTTPAQALYWARFTNGSLGASLHLSSLETKEKSFYEIKRELVNKIANLTLENALETAEWFCAVNKNVSKSWADGLENVSNSDITRRTNRCLLRMVMSVFGDAMKVNINSGESLINSDQSNEITKTASIYNADSCVEIIQKTYQSMGWVDSSVNERLIFEEMLLNFTESASM